MLEVFIDCDTPWDRLPRKHTKILQTQILAADSAGIQTTAGALQPLIRLDSVLGNLHVARKAGGDREAVKALLCGAIVETPRWGVSCSR